MAALDLDFAQLASFPVGIVDLEFAGSGILPIPIMQPNIAMVLTTCFQTRAASANRIVSKWNVKADSKASAKTAWSVRDTVLKAISMNWKVPSAIIQHVISGYGGLFKHDVLVWPAWTSDKVLSDQSFTCWSSGFALPNTVATEWQVPPIADYRFRIGWASPNAAFQQVRAVWRATGDTTYKCVLRWGPRPASYICSYLYRPPFNPCTLNFIEPGVSSGLGLVLNFTNTGNPLVCDFDIGGGLIPPLPEIPTVDTTKPITPPKRRSYVMRPEFRCYRVSDNQEVNIVNFSIAISRSQWGFNVSLQCGSRGDRELLFHGGPQEFRLLVNGYEFFFVAEEPAVNHRFGSTEWIVSGRSSVALLAVPHSATRSYTNSVAKGVAALCYDELAGTGWTLDFDMTQFNVPAGAFSYVNKTPLEAIAQIAAAIGGMIYPHGDTKTIQIRPQWPVTPWAMTTSAPDIAVHDNVIMAYSSQPISTPLCNAVFVRGEQQGVECKIKRTGTAGDLLAQDIVDPLITDQQAARHRGTAVLADSGRKDGISFVLPVMDSVPPALPGTLLGVTWQGEVFKGLVDSFSMTGSRSADGRVLVRQTVGVLRSYE